MAKLFTAAKRPKWPTLRPKSLLLLAVAFITTCFVFYSGPSTHLGPTRFSNNGAPSNAVGHDHSNLPTSDDGTANGNTGTAAGMPMPKWDFDISLEKLRKWSDSGDREDYKDVAEGYEQDGLDRSEGTISRLQAEKDMRKMWRYAYKAAADWPLSNMIYGNTMRTLQNQTSRSDEMEALLREDPETAVSFTNEKPVRFNPYPDYNSDVWKKQEYAPYEACKGASGELLEDLLVFKGKPKDWPAPKIGSYDVLNLDPNLCWERETRLGPFGLTPQKKKVGGETEVIDWNNVNWGDLQRRCVHKNTKRFDVTKSRKNKYLSNYPETASLVTRKDEDGAAEDSSASKAAAPRADYKKEQRTAILLRSYTGKHFTENDKQVIRAMISELCLKSGGEYQVFLLVHVKDRNLRIFNDPETYQAVLQDNIPPEFHGITVLWNDEVVWNIYTQLKDDNERSVHSAQWLSVQKFSHDHPQFDYVWNWEMDFRYVGHHYDLLEKLSSFARKQPRRGLWERNERWYIPMYHGDYDTTFRKDVEERHGNDTVWGPVSLPFIKPVGPQPPTESPQEDNYQWGVGEDADVITVGPIFDPVHSNWIIGKHVWGYTDGQQPPSDLPRRTTIVTQARVSRRLLDIMHVENMRGNHVASEMTPQTLALLHGFKAVFAPHPVFMDRDWDGDFVNQWFNPGEQGQSGGYGSPFGWGRERRFQGSTWYYRAEPPNRLYNNWMGWIDTKMGGKRWEADHGRPCLPSVLLHPVKDSEPTNKGHATGFDLAYG